ncbi:hypothetical protein M6I34_16370 [Burkholderiaceae bacterium FT117]|uniref:hypothetical protein n=1 Tax=Zeimonas sediminis TaxID=2944268 RepID=UPI002342FC7F|nr:hypothetical protein [Zeimonas sediminis]MCM5572093.1 hypothetical protein [Zeimonas sediminis]
MTPLRESGQVGPERKGLLRSPFVWLAFVSIWMLVHPFGGITHDSIFYTAEALYRLGPSAIRQDLFFLEGSPFEVSVFGRLYAVAIKYFGIVPGAWVMFAIGQLAWAAAALLWGVRLVPRGLFWAVAPVLTLMPHWYGEILVFRLAENFVTARTFAEPLSLLGLLAIGANRSWIGIALVSVALAVHPIMAFPAVIAVCLMLANRVLRCSWFRSLFLLLLAMVASVAVARIAFGAMDGDWLEATRMRNPFILPSEWSGAYYAKIAAPVLVLIAAARLGRLPASGLLLAIGMAAVSGVAASVFAEMMDAALVLQAQTWRSVWVAMWVAPLAAFAVAYDLWKPRRGLALLFLGAVPSAALSFYSFVPAVSWMLLAHALILLAVVERPVWQGAFPERFGIASFAFLFAGFILAVITTQYVVFENWQVLASRVSIHEVMTTYFGWILASALAVILRAISGPEGRSCLRKAMVLLVTSYAAFVLNDSRSAKTRIEERWISSGMPALREAIAGGSTVYWPENLKLAWLALGRANFISSEQAAAQMFDRRLSDEVVRRAAMVASFGGRDGKIRFEEIRRIESQPLKIAKGGAERLCAEQPDLVLILGRQISGGEGGTRVGIDVDAEVWVLHCGAIAR